MVKGSEAVLRFSKFLRTELIKAELKPRDMIDAQSKEIPGGFYISFDPRSSERDCGFKITICDLETWREYQIFAVCFHRTWRDHGRQRAE